MGLYNYYMVAFNCILYTGFFIVFSYGYIQKVENVEPKAWRISRNFSCKKEETAKSGRNVSVGGRPSGVDQRDGIELAKEPRLDERAGPISTVQPEAMPTSNFKTGQNSPSGQGDSRFQGEMSSRVTSEMISDLSISSGNNLTQEHYQIEELELNEPEQI